MDENKENDELQNTEINEEEGEKQKEETSQVEDTKPEEEENEVIEEEKGKEFVFNEKEKEYISRKSFNKLIVFGLVFALLLSALTAFIAVEISKTNNVQKVIVYKPADEAVNVSIDTNATDITGVVDQIDDTVVEVYTEKAMYSSFYGQYVTEGAGSGVIYSKDGFILTNNHVIDGATSIKVKTNDGVEYTAELIATDAVSDIAVLKIDAENLRPAMIGSSANLKVGENCIAIGNPLGTLGGSVSTGIISALSREIKIDGQKMNLLQTTASINPGNSGGGLFNYRGELIAIVNAKSAGSDVEGIGFAIPVDYVSDVAEQLITNGYVLGRPAIGISCTSIESVQQAWNYGVSSYGVIVNEVTGENAKKAGLEKDDLIIGLDDIQITSYNDLKSALGNYAAGDSITLTVLRGRNQVKITLELEQRKN